MNEEFLHYIWSQELFSKNLVADTGESVEVITIGTHNRDSGPDFINARIKIDQTIWAGNIEIHIDSSHWEMHKHHTNAAYDNVILHVVDSFSNPVFSSNGRKIPTVVIQFEQELFAKYKELTEKQQPVPCHHDLNTVNDFLVNLWLDSLIIERLENKTEYIKSIFEHTKNNWEETFYIALARNFGFNTNALPFEMLAKSIPLKILSKYKINLQQLEALLFGQAGFFGVPCDDLYYTELQKEYTYFQKAHQLNPIENHLWKFLRLRPQNFPTIRIAQFASLVNHSQHLFSRTIDANDVKELIGLYQCQAGGYWEEHFNFGNKSNKAEKKLGKSSITGLFINTVIPFLFLYGKHLSNQKLQDKALSLLEQLPAEANHVVKDWSEAGIKAYNAYQSQALLQLTNEYCNKKNCLYCQIGNSIIQKTN